MTKITEIPKQTLDTSSYSYIKSFTKRMLKTQIFMGTFQEKRYVEPLKSYRHVVRINPEENYFIDNLKAVKKKLTKEPMTKDYWIGITDPETIGAPVGYNLWVELPMEILGTYWFKVKTVEFLTNEIRLKIDAMRAVGSEVHDSNAVEEANGSFVSSMQDALNTSGANLKQFLQENITFTNVKSTVIFLSVLLVTLATGIIQGTKYLLEYLLKFMREFSGVVKAFTPIVISFIELIRKVIYGFYSLIAFLFYGARQPNKVVYPDRLQYQGYNGYRALEYERPYRSSVTITPLDD